MSNRRRKQTVSEESIELAQCSMRRVGGMHWSMKQAGHWELSRRRRGLLKFLSAGVTSIQWLYTEWIGVLLKVMVRNKSNLVDWQLNKNFYGSLRSRDSPCHPFLSMILQSLKNKTWERHMDRDVYVWVCVCKEFGQGWCGLSKGWGGLH